MSSIKVILITTVGASLLINLSRKLSENLNLDDKEINSKLIEFIKKEGKNASAEVNSIEGILNNLKKENIEPQQVHLIFLVSDTKEGKLCGNALEEYYKNKGFTVNKHVVNGLKYDEKEFMNKGLIQLVHELSEIVREGKREKKRVIINATGGFKAESAYATLVGILNRCEVYYIHEKFKEIVELPPLPISIKREEIEKHINILKEISIPKKLKEIEAKYGKEKINQIKPLTIKFKENNEEYITLGPAGRAFIMALIEED